MWIRNSFLDSEVEFEKVVVHGHTPAREVHVDGRRIGVDTKAYESDRLTAVHLVDGSIKRREATLQEGAAELQNKRSLVPARQAR